jgi:hypothetical protein
MDTAAFDKFRESFTAFEEQVKAVRAGTKEVSTSFVGVSANAVRMWASVSHHTKTMAGNIASATRSLLRWAEIGGIISGLLGVGSLWGIDRLAIAAGNQRRNALGQNITPGEQRGFAATFGRLSDPGQFLGAVNAAMHDVTLRPGLYGAGLSESDIRGKDTGQVADSLVNALKKIADQTPESMMAQVLKARHLDQFITLEDFERYKHTPAAEIAGYQREYQARRRELELTKEQQKAWQGLQVQLHFAGMAIETSLIRALTPLAPQIKKLSEAFVGVFDAFAKNPEVAHWIDSLSDALGHFASYVGTPQFKQDISEFVTHVGEAARAIGEFAKWVWSVLPGHGEPVLPNSSTGGTKAFPYYGNYTGSHANDDWSWMIPKPFHAYPIVPGLSQGFTPMSFRPGESGTFRSWGDLLYAVEGAESSHGHDLSTSRAGAAGWMQITPDAWHDFATGGQTNPMDRKQSWEVAQNELSHYMKVYGSDLQKVLAAYNWGPRHVNEAMAYARKYGRSWLDDPRMPSETHGYLKKILGAGGDTGAYQQKFRNSRTQVDIRNNTGGNATVTAAQLAT